MSVARTWIKAFIRAQGLKPSHFASDDITKAAKQVIAADTKGFDDIIRWAWQGLELPNGL